MTHPTLDELQARAKYTLTQSEARNPQRYQEAKAEAIKAQASVIIIADPDPNAPQATKSEFDLDIAYLRDMVVCRREAIRDPAEYRRVRNLCEQTKRPLQMVESFDDLPDNLKQRVRDAVAGKPSGPRETSDPLAS